MIPDAVLARVTRPARYINGEPNAVHKDHSTVRVKFALSYPDVYEIGMSNLGLRLLYHYLNQRPDTAAERVFAPWTDMEAEMRRLGLPLTALESGRPVRHFDFLGFSLQYELTYTNLLNLLDLAGLPLLAAERREDDPLVIGGGPGAYNPEPLAPFFDLFLLGEAEEAAGELLDAYLAHLDGRRDRPCASTSASAASGASDSGSGASSRPGRRTELLAALARVPGVYVPAFYDVTYKGDGTTASVTPNRPGIPERVTKRRLADLDRFPLPERPIMPFIETVHDRAVIEVMRGCTRGCRFCQAGMIYRPARERSGRAVLDTAGRILSGTGYEEVSLSSLSTCDWGPLAEVVDRLVAEHGRRGVAVSLSSLRTDTFSVELASRIQEVRKTGLTFAPEAGSARLRAVINKGVTEEDLLQASGAAFRAGWDRLKLYYMIGLPTETDEDLEAIHEQAHRVTEVYRTRGEGKMVAGRPLALTVSLAAFVPKAHTPFEREPQVSVAEAGRRIDLVRDGLTARGAAGAGGGGGPGEGAAKKRRRSGIKVDWHSPEMSRIEGVFARGDRRLAGVLIEAWRRGARFDGWTESFDPERWDEAFQAAGVDPAFYTERERGQDEVLPWEHLSSGVERRFLARERERAFAAEFTADCRQAACSACGVCENTEVVGREHQDTGREPRGGESR